MFRWIATDEQLPEEGRYVLGIHNRGTWHDSDDQEHVNMVVVKLKKGISQETRAKMKSGELEDPEDGPYSTGWSSTMYKRSSVESSCDEGGNNQRPYNWKAFGPDSFFGQSITHWCDLPSPPIEYIMGENKHVPIEEKVQAMANEILGTEIFKRMFPEKDDG